MKKIITLITTMIGTMALATSAMAQVISTNPTVGPVSNNVWELFRVFKGLVNASIGVLVTLALAVFFYGLVRYILRLGGDSAEETAKDKNLMIYGIIALFVMTSVWGLVSWLGGAVGVGPGRVDNVAGLVPNGGNY